MQTPRAVLLAFYEAEAEYMTKAQHSGNADFSKMRLTMSPKVVLHQSPDLPFGGDYQGHDGYEDWAKRMSRIFDRLEVSERQFFEQGETVVVVCRFRTRSRVTALEQDYPMVQVVRVEDGQIVDFRPFYWNVPEYKAAAGLK